MLIASTDLASAKAGSRQRESRYPGAISSALSLSWRDLPMVGEIHNAEKDIVGQFRRDLSGKRVLCIGYSEEEIDELVMPYHPASIEMLTKWEGHRDSQVTRYSLTIGDICKWAPFDDGHFDAVMMLSVMEHLDDLPAALNETRRLLCPGGELLTFFGPAWSCPYGHHLYLQGGHPLLDFSKWQLPAYLHLLCSEEEVRRFVLDHNLNPDYAQWFVRSFWELPIINRLMFDDYLRAFGDGFQLLERSTSYCAVPEEFITILRDRYPANRDFTSYGGGFVLKAWV